MNWRNVVLFLITVIALFGLSLETSDVMAQTGNDLELELIGHIGAGTNALFVEGNLVYIGEGPQLTIFDVSTLSNPTIIGKSPLLPNIVSDITVRDNYAYVAVQDKGLQIIDISNPTNPILTGSYFSGYATAKEVKLSGNYAYLAAGYNGLLVIDISDPANPILVSRIEFGDGGGYEIAISGNYIYVGDGSYGVGLQVININDPANPVIVSNVEFDDYVSDVEISGNYVYALTGHGNLQVINISDPANPIEVGNINLFSLSEDIAVNDNYVYITAYYAGLKIVNISDPTNPTLVGSIGSNEVDASQVAISDNYAYVIDNFHPNLHIIDINDPTNPDLVSNIETEPFIEANGLSVMDNYVYVADEYEGLQVVDISDLTNPILIGGVDIPVDSDYVVAYEVDVSGNYAYVVTGDEDLQVIDISDPTNPTLVSRMDISGYIYEVVISDSYAYVTAGLNGLQVIDISDPTNLIVVGTVEFGQDSSATEVDVSGNYAYVVTGDGNLQVIDISGPTNPIVVGTVGISTSSGYGYDVEVSGTYAYVIDNRYGDLQVINISDPTNPTVVSSVETFKGSQIVISGNYAYVVDFEVGMQVINIGDPTNPILVGGIEIEYITGIVVKDNYVYLGGWDGVFIFRQGGEPTPTPVLQIDTTSLNFTTAAGSSNPVAQSFTISNIGDGTLTWTVSDNVDWLTLSTSSGTDEGMVNVFVDVRGVDPGTYQGQITIDSDGGKQTVDVSLNVTSNAVLAVTPLDLFFTAPEGQNPSPQTITIRNDGLGSMKWTASSNVSWLNLSSSSGDGATTIEVLVNTNNLPAAVHDGQITISSTGAQGSPQVADVTLSIYKLPTIAITPTNPSFVSNEGSNLPIVRPVTIENLGIGTVNWTADEDIPWLSLDKTSGTAPSTINLIADPTDLEFGLHTASITLTDTGAQNSPFVFTSTLAMKCNSPRPADVVLTIDQSGSMSGRPLRSAKAAAKLFVDLMDLSTSQVGLVSFDDTAQMEHTLTHDGERIKYALDTTIFAAGGTNIAVALEAAQTELLSNHHNPNNMKVIVLLSDGASDGDPIGVANQAKANGIHITTIGLGSPDKETLEQIASTSSDYYHVPDTQDLDDVYFNIGVLLGCQATVDGFTISGKVINNNDIPISGVMISANDQYKATTDNSGYYFLRGLVTETYTITPSKGGYLFTPTNRIVSVPPNTVEQDFVGHGNPISGNVTILPIWPQNHNELSEVMQGGISYRHFRLVDENDNSVTDAIITFSIGNDTVITDQSGYFTSSIRADDLGGLGTHTVTIDNISTNGVQQLTNPVTFNITVKEREYEHSWSYGLAKKASVGISTGIIAYIGGEIGGGLELSLNEKGQKDIVKMKQFYSTQTNTGLGLGLRSNVIINISKIDASATADFGVKPYGSIQAKFNNPYSSLERQQQAIFLLLSILDTKNGIPVQPLVVNLLKKSEAEIAYLDAIKKQTAGLATSLEVQSKAGLEIGMFAKKDSDGKNKTFSIDAYDIGTKAILINELIVADDDYTMGYETEMNVNLALLKPDLGPVKTKVALWLTDHSRSIRKNYIYNTNRDMLEKVELILTSEGNDLFFTDVHKKQVDVIFTIEGSNLTDSSLHHQVSETASVSDIETLLNQALIIPYRVEVEDGSSFSFQPEISIPGTKVDVGTGIEVESQRTLTWEQGYLSHGQMYPTEKYEADDYVSQPGKGWTELTGNALGGLWDLVKDSFNIITEEIQQGSEAIIGVISKGVDKIKGGAKILFPDGFKLFRGSRQSIDVISVTAIGWVPTKDNNGLEQRLNNPTVSAASGEDFVVGGIYQFQPFTMTMEPGATLEITYTDEVVLDIDESKVAMFQWSVEHGNWQTIPSEADLNNNLFTAQITQLGTFALGYDETPPQIVPLEPTNGDTITNTLPVIGFLLADAGVGIASETIEMQLDGQVVEPSYVTNTGELLYLPENPLNTGEHTIVVSVSDAVDNRTSIVSKFIVGATSISRKVYLPTVLKN